MKFWQVDAFTDQVFTGNPAAVFVLDKTLSDELMIKIAGEMNLAETVFVVMGESVDIRWFKPTGEVDLCGHGTLAAAHVLWQEGFVQSKSVVLHSKSGPLTVRKADRGYTLDFPLYPTTSKPEYMDFLTKVLGEEPEYIGSNGKACIVAVSQRELVDKFSSTTHDISLLEENHFLITAQDLSGEYDYLYRCFYPRHVGLEDPVTGSANTCLVPYWATRLNKTRLLAKQVSERSGILDLEIKKECVLITGSAITVFEAIMCNTLI